MMSERQRLLWDHIRLYRRLGLIVFPVWSLHHEDDRLVCDCRDGSYCDNPGKHPTQTGWQAHTVTSAGFCALHNVGIATGAASGTFVVDVDPRNGGDKTLAALEREHGPLPPTWRFITGGRGDHFIFKHPGFYVAGDSKGKVLGPGLDIKGDGGLIVAPPSLHFSGRRYAISVDHHPDEVPLAGAPEWLLAMLPKKKNSEQQRQAAKPATNHGGLSRYGLEALDCACKRIASAPAGSQDMTLNTEVFGIGQLVGGGEVPEELALDLLRLAAAEMPEFNPARPWRPDKLDQKIMRSFSEGVADPRSAPR